jgi:hypothetical protein
MAQDGQNAEPSAADIAEMRVAQIRNEIRDLLNSMGANNAEMTRLAAEIAGDVQNWRAESDRLKTRLCDIAGDVISDLMFNVAPSQSTISKCQKALAEYAPQQRLHDVPIQPTRDAFAIFRDLESECREQAQGSQDGWLLNIADRMATALSIKQSVSLTPAHDHYDGQHGEGV